MELSAARRDHGFTLIEVLVVVIIIGILSAIAIPAFASQRHKAVDASMKTDARTLATHLESYWLDRAEYPTGIVFTAPTVTFGEETVTMSPGNIPRVFGSASPHSLCIQVTNPGASDPVAGVVWMVDAGGLQALGSTCSGYPTPVL